MPRKLTYDQYRVNYSTQIKYLQSNKCNNTKDDLLFVKERGGKWDATLASNLKKLGYWPVSSEKLPMDFVLTDEVIDQLRDEHNKGTFLRKQRNNKKVNNKNVKNLLLNISSTPLEHAVSDEHFETYCKGYINDNRLIDFLRKSKYIKINKGKIQPTFTKVTNQLVNTIIAQSTYTFIEHKNPDVRLYSETEIRAIVRDEVKKIFN